MKQLCATSHQLVVPGTTSNLSGVWKTTGQLRHRCDVRSRSVPSLTTATCAVSSATHGRLILHSSSNVSRVAIWQDSSHSLHALPIFAAQSARAQHTAARWRQSLHFLQPESQAEHRQAEQVALMRRITES